MAIAWLTLAADQSLLSLAQDTQKRQALGADSGRTLAQTEATVASARNDVASYTAQVQQDLNALQIRVGTTVPAELLSPAGLLEPNAVLIPLPAGLPSEILQRRPDALAAEHALKAANALAIRASLTERLHFQGELVQAWQRCFKLSQARFRGSADSHLNVLTAQRSLHSAQRNLISLQLADLRHRVTLYKVLGGGWKIDARQVSAAP